MVLAARFDFTATYSRCPDVGIAGCDRATASLRTGARASAAESQQAQCPRSFSEASSRCEAALSSLR